uniref:Transposase n=1 Tax=Rodentolepis nana TaxID=102285 RepID=A0A0R3TZC2_RODNA
LTIFGEEKRICYEIDAAAYYILFFESIRTNYCVRRRMEQSTTIIQTITARIPNCESGYVFC